MEIFLRTKFFQRSCIFRHFHFRTAKQHEQHYPKLKELLSKRITEERKTVTSFRKQFGPAKVGDVTVNMLYDGMRGLRCVVNDTSMLDTDLGIKFRNRSMPEVRHLLPKFEKDGEPLPEGVLWLLLSKDFPNKQQATYVSKELADRSEIPPHVAKLLRNMPSNAHPMTRLVSAVAALSSESLFNQGVVRHTSKDQLWEYVYEDVLSLIAKLPVVAAHIYHSLYSDADNIPSINRGVDWGGNFAKLLGHDNPCFDEFLRLYLTINSDHEGGNVPAHATHLVGSALTSPYLALTAGLAGMAGPLCQVSQSALSWLKQLVVDIGESPPKEHIAAYIEDRVRRGESVPGYGHPIVHIPDPRFLALHDFGSKHLPGNYLFNIATQVYEVAPPILKNIANVKNPWPSVDAISGAMLEHYGIAEPSFHSVIFAVSRSIGILSSLIWDRALNFPVERPKSVSSRALMKMMGHK